MENGVTTATPAPQYAPHDPTLPEPWRVLVDTSTGYIYYWNPHTNITQYERPIAAPPLPPGPPPAASAPKFVPLTTADPSLQNQSAPVHTQAAVQQGTRSDSTPSVQQVARSDSMPTVHQGGRSDSIYPNSSGLIPAQPKLAPIPVSRSQQGIGEVHLSHASTGHHSTSISSGVRPNMLKRGASDQSSSSQDFKRPRLHGFSDLPNASDIESYKRQHEVSALGENVPAPFITFDAAGIPSEILREMRYLLQIGAHVLQNAGFLSPTPIQAQSWPIALQGRDIVAIAKTGSGKTLGYLLPAFLHLRRCQINSHRGATVLVLAPTRELATQIQEEAVKFGRSSRITSTCIYGGAPKGPQLRDLERGADIVVATPGRLNDFLEVRKINLQQVSFLVLDEADRMLDMGFEPQIRKIVNEIPSRRQTLMYTATWPKEVRKIASDLLVNPVQVNIGNIDELSANKSITQCVEFVAASEKHRRLEQILCSQEPGSKILVFCSTKKMCDQLTRILSRQFGAAAIHGDKSQSERDWVLTQFRTGRSPVLIATDVAARGLDIKDIRIVINFDFPTGIEDYVHRIGRTGRAGATGLAYTFFSDHDAKYAQDLVKVLEVAGQRVPPELRDVAARSGYNRGRGGRWDSGGHSGRVGGRGGRDGGRGYSSGRGEFFGARNGGWGMSGGRVVRQDRVYDRFGGRGRFDRDASSRFETFPGKYDRDSRERHQKGGHSRYFDDGADRSRGSLQKFDERLRGRSYSRSYSRSSSSSRSRGRSYSRSRSRGRSYSRSRSRSQSYDRYDGKVVLHKGSSFTDVRSNSPSKLESMTRHGLPVRNGPLRRPSVA